MTGEAARAEALIAAEIAGFEGEGRAARMTLAAFQEALVTPEAIGVQFSGGHERECWAVTALNGPYRVVFMAEAGYFRW